MFARVAPSTRSLASFRAVSFDFVDRVFPADLDPRNHETQKSSLFSLQPALFRVGGEGKPLESILQ
jgi:hypothetical protein